MGSTQSRGDTDSAERGFYSKIARPTLLLDKARALRNIARIAEKTRRDGVRFRPHFKTHQSAEIGEWIRAHGVEAICVSSVEMAAFFADHGWRDIAIAFPVNFGLKFGIGHADAAEASIMMAMHPESVDLSALPPLPGPLKNVDWAIVDSDTFRGRPSPDHTLSDEADPRRCASAERGRQMIEQSVVEIEQIVREALMELGYPPPSGVAE